MIETIKQYTSLVVLTLVLSMLAFTHYKAYQSGQGDIQVKFDAYRSKIDDQLQTAKNEKIRIEAEQDAKAKQANEAYQRDLDRLNDALDRMRKSTPMPGNEALPVAGDSSSGVSGEAEDTSGAINPSEITTGIRQTSFYSDAMMDALQCSRLISICK